MDELLEIINRIGADDPPTDEELTDARAKLVELLTVAAEGEERDLAAARELRGAIDKIDAELAARKEAAEAEEEEAKKLLEGIDAQTGEPDGGEEGGGEEGEEGGETEDKVVLPVAAANLGSAIKRTSARVQRDAEIERDSRYDVRVRAVGAAQGYPLDLDSTMDDVAKLFARDATAVRSGKQSLVRIEKVYPDDRQLGKQAGPNNRLIDQVFAPEHLTNQGIAAAGGICGPLEADFTHPICGDRGRPIRDALPQFQADRGGIRFAPSATLADVVGGITVWTAANDANPTDPLEKACLVIDCEDELSALVDAVVQCVQIGNFQARFNPEFWASRLSLLDVAHDRTAETKLYNELVAEAIAVTYAGADGTIYSVLSAVDKAVAGLTSRLRLIDTGFQMIAPDWLHQALRADIARQQLGSSPAEQLAVADQIIDSFFTARGVTPIWSPDVDPFGAQAAGPLLDFPGTNVVPLVYPVGTYMFLDGGTLDLGTEITDSTLNATNDRQAFKETFEKGVKRGCEALSITIPIDEACLCLPPAA